MKSMLNYADALEPGVTPADAVIPLYAPEAFKRFPEGNLA
jgi:hypothetical protein